jgi:hypothetical protein
MRVNQLSENGYKLTEVFNNEFLTELKTLVDTFTPTSNRDPYDAPELPLPLAGANRAVLTIKDTQLKNKILANFFEVIPNWNSVELWRDTTGYRQEIHVDVKYIHNVIIVYLDGSGTKNMGTVYFENNNEYYTEYKENTGLKLFNSNKIKHGMIGTVDGIEYRKILYITWK